MQINDVLAYTFFEGLDYTIHALLSGAQGGQALSRTSEEFLNLLDKLSKGNQGYKEEIIKTTTQKATGILDVDQATTINFILDAMKHNMAYILNIWL